MALEPLRGRMPLLVLVLLLLLCLGMLGLACACFDDGPALAFQPTAVPVTDVWPALTLALLASALLASVAVRVREQASPAFLQRFLL